MNASPQSPRTSSTKETRGFALLITITLLAFLVLLLVSLASLTRVETQVASNNHHLSQARQNALLALNIALGQLQEHTGPDQRVTARADVTIPPGVSIDADTPATSALDAIDTYWRASRNRQWTGVWRNQNSSAYNPENPAAFNPAPGLLSWLVSGNETASDTFKPGDIVSGLTPASTALDRILDSAGKPHRLLVKASAEVTNTASLDRAVTAPEIEIKSSSVPGIGTSDTTVGHYAWWIGDEGVKARANLVDPYALAPAGENPDERLRRETKRRQSAQRPAIEAMTTTGADGLVAFDPVASDDLARFQANLGKVSSPAQLGYLDTAATLPTELKTRFHDLSVSSRGVLSDPKHGGLKADLTYVLGQSNPGDFRTALQAVYDTLDIAPLAIAPGDITGNPALIPSATPYATLPSNPSFVPMLKNSASWEQLWSFHNLGNPQTPAATLPATPPGLHDASGQAVPRIHNATQHGLSPLIIQCKTFYRLRIVGGSPDPDGVNRTGKLHVDTIPLAVLANPYSVPLAPADYHLRISGSRPNLVFGSTDNTTTPTADFIPAIGKTVEIDDPDSTETPPPKIKVTKYWPQGPYSEPSNYMGGITLVLRSTGMAAGEAQIFTIDPDPSVNPTIDSDDRILVANANDARLVVMKNDYDPVPALTYNTDRTIPNAALDPGSTDPAENTLPTRAALRLGNAGMFSRLYIDYEPTQGDLRLAQYVYAQPHRSDAFETGENNILIVDPMADGIRQGGGNNLILNQPPTTDNLAPFKNNQTGLLFTYQQAPFYQVNYRTLTVLWAGNSTYNHPLEWARKFVKNGSTGTAGNTPNPWIAANLLRPSGSTTTVRWGIVNIGEGQEQTVPPASIGGASATNVGFTNLLYDIPRPDHPLASLGQLQHFNTAGYIPATNFDTGTNRGPTVVNAWQVNYSVANSYPQPRVPRDRVNYYISNTTISLGYHYDGSYLWNDLLWDRFFFSTYPQNESFDFASDSLINSRYRPFRDPSVVAGDDESGFRGDGNPATAANSRLAAQNLLVEGAFNINSTSVEAWKALFSSLKNVPVGTETAPTAPFARTLTPTKGSADAKTGDNENAWAGFRDLTRTEIQSLAEEMVMQVRKRGPFLSLSEFVNRRLISSGGDTFGLGLSGALQATIDRVINQPSDVASKFNTRTATHNITLSEPAYIMRTGLSGFPGYLLQGDVLSALGPTLAARSDTFTIRTYGDTVNPVTNEVTARAWCEAVVQRTPDYVVPATASNGNAPHEIPAANSTNATFGRRYHIVSFRWLGPEDI